jgi:hypothetical protein
MKYVSLGTNWLSDEMVKGPIQHLLRMEESEIK